MRDERIAFTTHGFSTETSMRDLIKLASGNSLLVWDEIEQYLDAETESNFKKLIDSNPTKFIDKYETVEASYKPIAMYGATSNQREFKLSDTGSRRLFHIPIKWVDTDKLDTICWWRIVNDLKKEIADHTGAEPPWLLSRNQLIYQASLHSRITAKSGLELTIREIYNFNAPCFFKPTTTKLEQIQPLKSQHFQSSQKVIDTIFRETNGMIKINRAQLARVLHNLCGGRTSTKTRAQVIVKPKLRIDRGLCVYGGQHQLWVLPERNNPYNEPQ